ncbi:Uncharacterized protein APZ42_032480 [Daphnia magna]|uniref:Uncharacterized protein n=1 Tax=Daphnia magna TaxID=35525 RepID=A0A164LK89_9CRUS|nr:Uncharacterized protein APZ42_032480 [Daphnia magna]
MCLVSWEKPKKNENIKYEELGTKKTTFAYAFFQIHLLPNLYHSFNPLNNLGFYIRQNTIFLRQTYKDPEFECSKWNKSRRPKKLPVYM